MSEGVLIGALRDELSLSLQTLLSRVIDKNKDKESYYALVVATMPEDKIIKTSIVLTSQLPKKMLNTICYFVNNKTGEVKRLWALPLDIEIPDMLLTGDGVKEVYDSGQGMPIINRG